MSEPILGEIRLFACDFAPRGWAPCDGSLLTIKDHQALFALLGVTYGGDGKVTFALPDLRGRVAIMYSADYPLAKRGGSQEVALTTANLPSHNHLVRASATGGDTVRADGNYLAGSDPQTWYATQAYSPTSLNPNALTANGGAGLPHDNMQPYLALMYCISVSGMFPPRPTAGPAGETAAG